MRCEIFSWSWLYKSAINNGDRFPLRLNTIDGRMLWITHVSEIGNWPRWLYIHINSCVSLPSASSPQPIPVYSPPLSTPVPLQAHQDSAPSYCYFFPQKNSSSKTSWYLIIRWRGTAALKSWKCQKNLKTFLLLHVTDIFKIRAFLFNLRSTD